MQNFDRCVTGTHVSWLMDTGMKTELTAFERMLSGNAEFKGCARGNKPNR